MIPYVMVGAAGRMGRAILELSLSESPFDLQPVGALVRAGAPDLGQDIGELSGRQAVGVCCRSDFESSFAGARVAIDFSPPGNCLKIAEYCAQKKIGLVVGTTGLNESQQQDIFACAREIPLLWAPNMSVGVHLLFELVELAARSLTDFEAEIVEAHHNQKKDAPSGTAHRLKEILLEVLDRKEEDVVYGRQGEALRSKKEIGIHALRAGDIPGEHTVHLVTAGERLELTHRASSRAAFAHGALRAAAFIATAAPGVYSMRAAIG